MRIFESAIVALQALVSNKLRAALTMLGVIFGVAAVISGVALGEGANRPPRERIQRFGTNALWIRPGQFRMGGIGSGMGSMQSLTPEDAEALRKSSPAVAVVAPETGGLAQVKFGNRNTN